VREQDSRDLPLGDPLTLRLLARKYVVDPRRYPDYSWNWLSRFLFFFGLTLNTTFIAFFLAARLGIRVQDVAGTVAAVAGLGVLATAATVRWAAGSSPTSCAGAGCSCSSRATSSPSVR